MGWTPTAADDTGWSPVPDVGAAAATAGSILRGYFNFAALGSSDWQAAGDVAHSLTPDGGSVTGAFNWTVANSANMTAGDGPDGSTGITILPTSGRWFNEVLPTAPYFWASVNDAIGSTPDDETDIWVVAEFAFNPDTNHSQIGIGIADANKMVAATRYYTGSNVYRGQSGTSYVNAATADTSFWLALRVSSDTAHSRTGLTGTDDLPTTFKDSGTTLSRGDAGGASYPSASGPNLDLNAAKIVLWCGPDGAGTATGTFKSIRIYEVVT